MSFESLAAVAVPGRPQLKEFVLEVKDFLGFVLSDAPDFGFLWEGDSDLRNEARETFYSDVSDRGVPELIEAVDVIPQRALAAHGIEGRPLRFKLRVLDSIARQWGRFGPQLSVRKWFKKMVDAIDAVLDSLIDAAGGAGGLIKEFKDALAALA